MSTALDYTTGQTVTWAERCESDDVFTRAEWKREADAEGLVRRTDCRRSGGSFMIGTDDAIE